MKMPGKWRAAFGFLVISGLLWGVALFWLGASSAQAAAPQPPKSGLAISPPTFELSANPGDTLKNSLRVDNITNESMEVTVTTRNFSALGEEGGVNLSEDEGEFSLAKWITVSPSSFTIPANESKVFDYTIAIPSNAPPGGRFGSIIFKTAVKPISGQSGVAVGQEIGALVFLKVAGEVKENASIASFSVGSSLYDSGPVDFEIRVKNHGNVQIKPIGTITISNFLGQKIATIPIDEKNVLPGAIRKLSSKWDSGLLFGKYNATLSLVYGNGKQVLTASTTFWGFPYKLVFVVLVLGAFAAAVIYPRRQRIVRAFKVLFGKE
jgi:hypothetical protein